MLTLRTVSAFVAVGAVLIWVFLPGHQPGFQCGFDPEKVLVQAFAITSRSWEYGTLVQALLEFKDPHLTVFGQEPFPRGRIPGLADPSKIIGLQYARTVIWTNDTEQLIDGEGKPTSTTVVSWKDNIYKTLPARIVLTLPQAHLRTPHL